MEGKFLPALGRAQPPIQWVPGSFALAKRGLTLTSGAKLLLFSHASNARERNSLNLCLIYELMLIAKCCLSVTHSVGMEDIKTVTIESTKEMFEYNEKICSGSRR